MGLTDNKQGFATPMVAQGDNFESGQVDRAVVARACVEALSGPSGVTFELKQGARGRSRREEAEVWRWRRLRQEGKGFARLGWGARRSRCRRELPVILRAQHHGPSPLCAQSFANLPTLTALPPTRYFPGGTPAHSLEKFDWAGALRGLSPDEPIQVTFDEHVAALQRARFIASLVIFVLFGLAVWSCRMCCRRRRRQPTLKRD